jgi:hypothetical protein
MHYLAPFAATAAYCLIHAFWYSHYLLRAHWIELMGHPEAQVRQRVLLAVPQLVTVAWSLSFTAQLAGSSCTPASPEPYAVSRPVFSLEFPSGWEGSRSSLYLGLPIDLIWIHGPSTLIASLVAGAILGAWSKGRILRALDCV